MKKHFTLAFLACSLLLSASLYAQDAEKKPSPPMNVTEKLDNGATITIDYSAPSLKGRTIGETVEPKKGKVWRMGANWATTFETDKDIKVEGKELPKGKYSVFGLWNDDGFTVYFNKTARIWGTEYEKIKDQNALEVTVAPRTTSNSTEQLAYTIDKAGKVTVAWGTWAVDLNVK